jgi:hypothetical protein
MKQTAIEWLLNNLITEPYSEKDFEHNSECWDKAKEMEKKQITETFVKVSRAHQEALGNKLSLEDVIDYKKIAELYYNEEYETKED